MLHQFDVKAYIWFGRCMSYLICANDIDIMNNLMQNMKSYMVQSVKSYMVQGVKSYMV